MIKIYKLIILLPSFCGFNTDGIADLYIESAMKNFSRSREIYLGVSKELFPITRDEIIRLGNLASGSEAAIGDFDSLTTPSFYIHMKMKALKSSIKLHNSANSLIKKYFMKCNVINNHEMVGSYDHLYQLMMKEAAFGLVQLSQALKHEEHLHKLSSYNQKNELIEIAKLLQDAVFTINGSLSAASSNEVKNSYTSLKKYFTNSKCCDYHR